MFWELQEPVRISGVLHCICCSVIVCRVQCNISAFAGWLMLTLWPFQSLQKWADAYSSGYNVTGVVLYPAITVLHTIWPLSPAVIQLVWSQMYGQSDSLSVCKWLCHVSNIWRLQNPCGGKQIFFDLDPAAASAVPTHSQNLNMKGAAKPGGHWLSGKQCR